MDDGGASACSIILFFFLLFIEAILTGFYKAIGLMNEKEIERRAEEEKDKKSILLNYCPFNNLREFHSVDNHTD